MVLGSFVLPYQDVSIRIWDLGRGRRERKDLLRFRNAWEVPLNSMVRSNVRVAVTLAATLKSAQCK